MHNDELKHYGVLGMKWGVHRAKSKGTSYTYKSHATKKYEKKSQKAKLAGNSAKAKKFSNRAKRSAQFDKKMQSQVEKSSAGKTTAKILLNGVFGAKTYEAMRASGYDRAISEGAVIAGQFIAGPLGNVATTSLARYNYVTKDE